MDLRTAREKLQVKEDRGHFGLSWSVLAAYGLALAVLFSAWHPRTRGMIDFRFVGIVVFMFVGAVGFYLSLASAMRWWPHNPRRRDVPRYEDVRALYLDGHKLFKDWGERVLRYRVLLDEGLLDNDGVNRHHSEFLEQGRKLVEWQSRADLAILNWFGESTCRTFITEPEILNTPPDWQRGDQWFTNWDQLSGRLAWLRRWLLEQDNL